LLEFILSKTILMVFSLAVLIASGSLMASYYSEQEMNETELSFQQVAIIVVQAASFDDECDIRLEMSRYIAPESILRIGNGTMVLFHDGQVLSVDLPDSVRLRVLGADGSETTMIELEQNDILVIERHRENDAFRTMIYIENVDATFSTAFTNRSTSSIVL
jgi:hypothetical protein